MAAPKDTLDEIQAFLRRPLKEIQKYIITADTHPVFMRHVEGIAGQVGIECPRIVVVPTPLVNAAGGPGTGTIFLTEGFLNMLGQKTLETAPDKKLEMVLAHEMSHIKDGAGKMLAGMYLPWMALPVAGAAAVYLYDKMHRHHDAGEVCQIKLKRALEQTTQEELDGLRDQYEAGKDAACEKHWKDCEQALAWQHQLWTGGKYLAGAALGLGGGLMLSRHLARSAEFRADRMAIKIGRDAEAYIEFLEDATRQLSELWHETNRRAPGGSFSQRVQDFVETELKLIKNDTMHAHPHPSERAVHARAYLNRLLQAEQAIHPAAIL
ncbi:MAG: M48 family metalloprotease [Alphaproteobacteria bacterium]|nr:M48 family metalloprotease [Alphaproteobacteria bacterium]